MNKKQLLSIAMLLSISALNANPLAMIAAAGVGVSAGLAKTLDIKSKEIAQLKEEYSKVTEEYSKVTNASVVNQLKNASAKTWEGAKALPGMALATAKATPSFVKSNTIAGYNFAKDNTVTGYKFAKDNAVAGYEFAKANPTTAVANTGAVAGLGYVAYRQADNAKAAVKGAYNWVKNNPVKTTAGVALAVAGYYKGDVAVAAAKTAANTVAGYMPTTPAFVTNAAAKVAGYMPTTPAFVNTGIEFVKANPYKVASYGLTAAQVGYDSFVGLDGSKDDKTATKTVEEVKEVEARYRSDVYQVETGEFKSELSKEDKVLALQQTIAFMKPMDDWNEYRAIAETKLAELQS